MIVVEDDANDFVLLKRALWKAGATARVWWAHYAAEALSTLSQLADSGAPVCIISDLRLPGCTGLELLDQIRSRYHSRHIKFAFLTGSGDKKAEAQAYAHGADAFFIKHAGSSELIDTARSLQKLATE